MNVFTIDGDILKAMCNIPFFEKRGVAIQQERNTSLRNVLLQLLLVPYNQNYTLRAVARNVVPGTIILPGTKINTSCVYILNIAEAVEIDIYCKAKLSNRELMICTFTEKNAISVNQITIMHAMSVRNELNKFLPTKHVPTRAHEATQFEPA